VNLLVKVKIRFMGSFRWAYGSERSEMELSQPANIRRLLETLAAGTEELRLMVGKDVSFDPRPSMIILVNEVEIGLLNGLETPLSDGDVLTLIPTAHGG